MYPGVAEYAGEKEPYRVFLNENTIRNMDPTFQGRPVFVHHVDGVNESLDALRGEADGWVVESFFNAADGKHWVKFIVTSERGERAIKQGMKLSNCYEPQAFKQGGLWNGVSYVKEITQAVYEHLAIVPNPRYEESVILTPEQFKKHNEERDLELRRLANDNSNKENTMKLKFFKRAKVENAIDLEDTSVVLPKSGKEMTITQLVNAADDAEMKAKDPKANDGMTVSVGGVEMPLSELVTKFQEVCGELEKMKASAVENEEPEDEETMENEEDDKEDEKENLLDVDLSSKKGNEEDDKKKADKEKADEADKKKANAKEKANKLKNAGPNTPPPAVAKVFFGDTMIARGKSKYGS
jgi:hypothetical protein